MKERNPTLYLISRITVIFINLENCAKKGNTATRDQLGGVIRPHTQPVAVFCLPLFAPFAALTQKRVVLTLQLCLPLSNCLVIKRLSATTALKGSQQWSI